MTTLPHAIKIQVLTLQLIDGNDIALCCGTYAVDGAINLYLKKSIIAVDASHTTLQITMAALTMSLTLVTMALWQH